MNKNTKSAKLEGDMEVKREEDFFAGKRPWSKIKDLIINNYLTPYLSKVSKLNKTIIIIDAFAGPGVFEDGKKGSPLIICETADRIVPGKYLALFANSDKTFHEQLNTNIKKYLQKKSAVNFLGEAKSLLQKFQEIIDDSTLLIYLDPFGLKGCDFSLLEPYLGREKSYSTETIINMSMPTLHRYATRRAVKSGRTTKQTQTLNSELSKILGGDEWKDIMWSEIPADEKEEKVISLYANRLKNELPYAGYCPVREKAGARTKYYIIFCSRHPDALRLMNDIMHNAYFGTLSDLTFGGTLFKSQALDLIKPSQNIEKEIKDLIEKYPGITRRNCWLEIIKKNFMVWSHSEFIKTVEDLVKNEEIKFHSPTKRLNQNAHLYPKTYNANPHTSPTKINIHWDYLTNLNNRPELSVKRINDGSIITRFDKTPFPENLIDVVCPHFLELKWAYGCPFNCSWCYLKGTFRFKPDGLTPVFKDMTKVKNHVEAFIFNVQTPELLNTGEISDSLMGEHLNPPFSKFILQLFEQQDIHKVLFLTKSTNIKNILELPRAEQAVFSFSLNSLPVAEKWEKNTPSVLKRIEAAKKLHDKGYKVRVRIDPIVPIENWETHYKELVDLLFENLLPGRITIGSLRGLQSTINGSKDKSWTVFLKEYSNWGKKVDFDTRYDMYHSLISYLQNKHNFKHIAICKETVEIWEKLEMDWKNIKCNCLL